MEKLPDFFFIKSRSKLKELLLPASVLIVSSSRMMPRNADQYYPFRQSSDLYYLTGIRQEECTLVFFPDSEPGMYREVIYIPEADEKKAKWDGDKLSPKSVRAISGIRNVKLNRELLPDIKYFLSKCNYVYFGEANKGKEGCLPSNEFELRRELASVLAHIEEHQLAPLMTRIRMFKQEEELHMIRKAISVSNQAFRVVVQKIHPGINESEVEAILSYEFHIRGSKHHAFDPIIASGKNALILHYIENNSNCLDGELLLMDFGADWNYYAADISRTIPVNGRFSKRQRELYEANLRVMKKAIHLMKPGLILRDLNKQVGALWEEEHVNLGLYSVKDIQKQDSNRPLWQKYYWHGTSHSIGIDVHDCFDQSIPLKAGMVMSCEPGIYIPEEETGIRLENDILITDGLPLNLSEDIPIEADAIEELMRKD